ncbi:MAG: thioesterase family protein [Desulfurococcus sp.]|nr:thioesterase family protein [Desulfurococcus sp.]
MEFKLSEGLYCEKEYIVREEHAASHIGSGSLRVLSTPSMIAFMERTALHCAEQYLPGDYTTVGTMVNIKHVNPAPVGAEIKVAVRLVSVDGRRLIFEVKAFWGSILIGEGLHERYIVNTAKFIEKVRSLTSMQQ